MKKSLARVDFLGNAVFMAAMIALLFGLAFNIPGIPGGLYCPLSWVFLNGQYFTFIRPLRYVRNIAYLLVCFKIALHRAGFGLGAIGNGSFSLLDGGSSTAVWACFQVLAAAGSGFILSIMLPTIMAALPESDVAVASSAYSFTRTFRQIWGIALASIVLTANLTCILTTSVT
jgi:hypothetical protein